MDADNKAERAIDMGAAFVITVDFARDERRRTPVARLEEACGLAEAIELRVVHREVAPLTMPRPATLIGSGKVDAIAAMLDARDPRPGLVIVDAALSPIQHRNLEKASALE